MGGQGFKSSPTIFLYFIDNGYEIVSEENVGGYCDSRGGWGGNIWRPQWVSVRFSPLSTDRRRSHPFALFAPRLNWTAPESEERERDSPLFRQIWIGGGMGKEGGVSIYDVHKEVGE